MSKEHPNSLRERFFGRYRHDHPDERSQRNADLIQGGKTPTTTGRKGKIDAGGKVGQEPRGLDTKYIKGSAAPIKSDLISTRADRWSAGEEAYTHSQDLLNSIKQIMGNSWTGEAANQMLASVETFSQVGEPMKNSAIQMQSHLHSTASRFQATQEAIQAASKGGESALQRFGDVLGGSSISDEVNEAAEEQRRLNEIVSGMFNPAVNDVNNHKIEDLMVPEVVGGMPGVGGSGGAGGAGGAGGGGGAGGAGGAGPSPAGVNVPKSPNGNTPSPSKGNPSSGSPNANTPSAPNGSGNGDKNGNANKSGTPVVPGTPIDKKKIKTTPAGLGAGGAGGGKGGGGGKVGAGGLGAAAKSTRPAAMSPRTGLQAAMQAEKAAASKGSGNPMMGRGASASKNADGKEHKSADYLVTKENTEEIIGEQAPVAPPVINE